MIFTDRPVTFLTAFTVIASIVSTIVGWRDPSRVNSLFAFLALVLALALTRGIISRDRRDSRWIMLFQRATGPVLHYSRVILLLFGLLLLLLALATLPLVVSRLIKASPLRVTIALFTGSVVWALTISCVMIGMSSLIRRYDLEIMLLLLTLSLLRVYLMNLFGAPSPARTLATYLLIPVDPVFMLWESLGSAGVSPSLASLAHLMAYPLVWLGIAATRILAFENSDLPGETEAS